MTNLRDFLLIAVIFHHNFINSLAHPHSWITNDGDDDYYFLNPKCESLNNVTFYSYHIHVLFWSNNNQSAQAAFKLRDQFMDDFNINDSIPCNDINTTHNESPSLCMVDFDYPDAACPFITPEWAVFVPASMFAQTVQWMMLHHNVILPDTINGNYNYRHSSQSSNNYNQYSNRNYYGQSNNVESNINGNDNGNGSGNRNMITLDIFIHPNSGCEIYDHTVWPLWLGNEWEIDTSCLHWDCPGYNYYDCVDKANELLFYNSNGIDNNLYNYQYYCNLTINNSTMMFNNVNTQNGSKKFCSVACQSWINKVEQFSLDCPNDCDFWKSDNDYYYLCKIYWNSLSSLKQESMYICGHDD